MPGRAGVTRAEYEVCQARDEAGFRTAIEAVTVAALQRGLQGINYRTIVAEEWRKGGFDEIMARRVDAAIEEIRVESSWKQLVESLAFKASAQALATQAAERVYRSDDIKVAIERMAVSVGREVGQRIELATSDAAEPAAQCIKAFLDQRFGSTVAGVVALDAGKEFTIDPAKGSAQISAGQVLSGSSEGIAGAVVLIVRRQLANMAARVGQRLVGAVLSRLVSVVAGGLGVVLIAKDVWELRNGVLPIISEEMKSASTRDKVQDELAKSISEQIGEHVREIGAKTADRIVDIWRDFRRAHAKVLELAEKNEAFRRFVDNVRPENLPRLDEVVGLVLASEGEAAILKRLDDGTLHEAVERMAPVTMEIARDTRSLNIAFKWSALAGEALSKVALHELHRRNSPDEFTRTGLQRLLALNDGLALSRLASLKLAVREPLFELSDPDLTRLARGLVEGELQSLSMYLTGLERPAAQRLLAAVAASPAKMQAVTPSSVREAILASRNQSAAMGMMLRADGIFDFIVFAADMSLVQSGDVSPRMLLARYPLALWVLSAIVLLVLLVLWRLLFGRRTRVIVSTGSGKN